MNIGELRRPLENMPDDGIVVFQPRDPDVPFSFPAMATAVTFKPIRLSDGKTSHLAVVELVPDDRGGYMSILIEPELLYKNGGFYINIINRHFFERLSDDALVRFYEHHEADLSLGKYFFPAIGVFSYSGPMSFSDGKEFIGVVIHLITNDRPYRLLADAD